MEFPCLFFLFRSYQALVQYENSRFAEAAKVALNGQNIYNGCCNLRVDFSKMADLSVRFNNDKSRDFTNPNLPSGDKNPSQYHFMHCYCRNCDYLGNDH